MPGAQAGTAGVGRRLVAPVRTGVRAAPARPRAAPARTGARAPDHGRDPEAHGRDPEAQKPAARAVTEHAGTPSHRHHGAARPHVPVTGRRVPVTGHAGRHGRLDPGHRARVPGPARAEVSVPPAGLGSAVSPVMRPPGHRVAADPAVPGPLGAAISAAIPGTARIPRSRTGGVVPATATTPARMRLTAGARRAPVGNGPGAARHRTGRAVRIASRAALPARRSGAGPGEPPVTATGAGRPGHHVPRATAASEAVTAAEARTGGGPPTAGQAVTGTGEPAEARAARAGRVRGPEGTKRRPGPPTRPARGSPTSSAHNSSTRRHALNCTACRTNWPTA